MINSKIKKLRNTDNSIVSHSKETPINYIKSEVKRHFNCDQLPTSRQELLELARKKNSVLNSHLSINLAKKENKAIDLLCEYRFDIEGGYQTFKNKVKEAKSHVFEAIELVQKTDMPETLIVGFSPDDSTLVDLSQIDANFVVQKWGGFDDKLMTHGYDENDLSDEGFGVFSEEQENVLMSLYSINDMYVDIGTNLAGYGLGCHINDV